MFSTSDTIVAIATPPGRGAIGIVRLSGPAAHSIATGLLSRAQPLTPRHATFARLVNADVRDQVVAVFYPSPASYTGDDVVELSAHGSTVVLNGIVSAAMTAGARLAAPGEFTLRAFLNRKIDLPRAEAVADLIDAATPVQALVAFDQLNGTLTSDVQAMEAELFELIARMEASVDFPDEGYHFVEPAEVGRVVETLCARIDNMLSGAARGRLIREGAQVVMAGRPNAGKSRLFNALVGSHRAIVSEMPGTTRDLLTEVVDLAGLRVTLIDTAGVALTSDPVEQEGVNRARTAFANADLVVHVVDGSVSQADQDETLPAGVPSVLVASKSDLAPAWSSPDAVRVSAQTGDGMDELICRIVNVLGGEHKTKDTPALSNLRHIELLRRSRAALARASSAVAATRSALSEEFVLVDLQEALDALGEVSGRRTPDDVLAHIFSRFCVGK